MHFLGNLTEKIADLKDKYFFEGVKKNLITGNSHLWKNFDMNG